MSAAIAGYVARLERAHPRTQPAGDDDGGGTPFVRQLAAAGLPGRAAGMLAAHAGATATLLASWALIGSGLLAGRMDTGWLVGWALALATAVPLWAIARRLESSVAIGVSALVKRRVLAGVLAGDVDAQRGRGMSGALSDMLEAQAIEQVGTTGGFQLVLAAVELCIAAVLLASAAASWPSFAVLAGFFALSVVLMRGQLERHTRWTALRLDVTKGLVERMGAHRTRLAQQSSEDWHVDEDHELAAYVASSRTLDRRTALIEGALPRAYVVASLVALAPKFVTREASQLELAVTLGVTLFSALAFERFTLGFTRALPAWIAWLRLERDFRAGLRAPHPSAPATLPVQPLSGSTDVVRGSGLSFANRGGMNVVLRPTSLAIARGDRVLLEGATGSGKSTLAALLAGFRAPTTGYLLAGGFDRATLGPDLWRRCVVVAPQHHENHVFSASLAFNLLLGRPLPHSPEDLREAREVCEALGLAPLLERMPAGLEQIVGDTGWRLSQGERGRLFMARALLQRADLTVLDESLGALDPENVRLGARCALARSRSLLLIAHP
jgi:ATP-binding cassette subfamily B protein